MAVRISAHHISLQESVSLPLSGEDGYIVLPSILVKIECRFYHTASAVHR